ncbi:MAG: hypothetical protein GX663_09805 [Clostridiales bacterium]|nr:hypothetical protein [Clostridiales bacterium]
MKRNWLIKKLNSKAGESLPEVLIAVLIVAMGMLMLSTMLNVSSRMIDKSQSKVKAVYADVGEIDKKEGVAESGKTVEITYERPNGTTAKEMVNIKLYRGDNLISYETEGLIP